MCSQYLVRLLCILLALPTMQCRLDFEVINVAKGNFKHQMIGNSQISERQVRVFMRAAYDFIKKEIYEQQEDPIEKKNIQKITLKIVEGKNKFDIVPSGNEITVSVDLFKSADSKALKREFNRKLYRAMTFLFLSADDSPCPKNLEQGIADFIVLEAHLEPADDWAQPGEGTSWSQSSSVTAQFLHYCDATSKGFVATLIKNLKNTEIEETIEIYFDKWWKQYKEAFPEK